MPNNDANPLFGIFLKVISIFIFTAMVAIVKLVANKIPTGEIVFARSFFGLIPVLIMIIMRGKLNHAIRTTRPGMHIKRAFLGLSAMYLWFSALKYLQLPDATAISYAMPLITVVLAYFILKEVIRIYRWTAVIVGFLGVFIILLPTLGRTPTQTNFALIGSMMAFASTILMAFAMIYVRRMAQIERTSTIVFWFSASSTIIALFTIPFGWVMPSFGELLLLILIGLSGGLGQILVTQSYRYADASTLAPFDYTSMIWAVIFGWFIFGEFPSWQVVLGSCIVIAAGLFVIYREHRLRINRTRSRRVSPPINV